MPSYQQKIVERRHIRVMGKVRGEADPLYIGACLSSHRLVRVEGVMYVLASWKLIDTADKGRWVSLDFGEYQNVDQAEGLIGELGGFIENGRAQQVMEPVTDNAILALLIEWTKRGEPPEVEYINDGPPTDYQE